MEGKLKDKRLFLKGTRFPNCEKDGVGAASVSLKLTQPVLSGERGQLNLHSGDECYGEYRTMC